MDDMTKVLVTGSKGYIGQHLIKMLANTSYEVVEFEGDVTDPYTFYSVDTVIHLAALVRVNESVKAPTKYYKNNVDGTINLLDRIVFNNFVFASSGTAARPDNPYALSKRICEDIVEEKCKQKGASFTNFRFYNVTGSDGFRPTNPDGLLYNLMNAVETGKFYLHGTDYNTGDGTCIRDYIHVNEICEALITAIHNPVNRLENLGSGVGYSVKHIIDTFKRVNNVDFEVIEGPRRPGDLESTVLEKNSLYLHVTHSLEQLLKVY